MSMGSSSYASICGARPPGKAGVCTHPNGHGGAHSWATASAEPLAAEDKQWPPTMETKEAG